MGDICKYNQSFWTLHNSFFDKLESTSPQLWAYYYTSTTTTLLSCEKLKETCFKPIFHT